jgi:hypothetical protein
VEVRCGERDRGRVVFTNASGVYRVNASTTGPCTLTIRTIAGRDTIQGRVMVNSYDAPIRYNVVLTRQGSTYLIQLR